MSAQGYEKAYVQEAFDTNWIAPLGPNVDGFEKELAAYLGVPGAAALSSGTAALHLALKGAGVGPGDVVLCSTHTFAASANPIVYLGASPVFIDSCPDTWNMSPAALERAFAAYPRAKAVVLTHLYGLAAELEPIAALCRERGAALIEDAAESLGTRYTALPEPGSPGDHGEQRRKEGAGAGSLAGKFTGTIGDYGVFSFNGNKIITTGGGGALVCNRPDGEERLAKIRFWATQSRDPARHYQHSELGYNYRMSNVAAGIGRGQLKVLEERIVQKRFIYEYYFRALGDLPGLEMMPVYGCQRSNFWLSCIRLSGKAAPEPAQVMDALEGENIESRPIWKPLHLQPFFAGCGYVDNGGTAQALFERGLCLPSDTKMTESDLERVCGIIRSLWHG
ncbi:MAG: DegT/DnrJ/EryC1/StrS family aminotransferase [Bacillota bacterium]|nr:DegT/DnrJ/EryC1/StrS family aminotransferase [Bacillota bacterium]